MITRMKNALMLAALAAVVLAGAGCDKSDFKKARKAGTIEAYREYIRRHPQGKFTAFAWEKIEISVYNRAEKENTVAAYRAYLSEFPNGSKVKQARREIRILCQRWARGLSPEELAQAKVGFTTSEGAFAFKLRPEHAPGHARNLLALAEEGFYTGMNVNTIQKNRLVHLGDPSGDGLGGPGYAIPFEPNPLRHVRGALTMLHTPLDPDTGGSQFIICLAEIPEYDGKFTVFGEIVEGIDTLDRISAAKVRDLTGPGSVVPLSPIAIEKVTVEGIKLPD